MQLPVTLRHEFVEFIPERLEEKTLYISISYATAAHNCCCGCGLQVVTPLTPSDWRLIFDGETVSLEPSIGNWSFPCRSHYWITGNRARWAKRRTGDQVRRGRDQDAIRESKHRAIPVTTDRFEPGVQRWGERARNLVRRALGTFGR